MARQVHRLSARSAATLSKPGRHSDGNGLYLVVDPSGAKRWLFLFRWGGKLKEMGLGGLSTTPLIQARERALEARRVLAGGRNPIDARRAAEAARHSAATFGAFADELVKDLSHGFRNEKHKGQWVTTLATHAAALRDRPLEQISTDDVLGVLGPIWQTKHETAVRLRGRIERVLDAAKAKGLRTGENPARWRGHLDKLLSKRRKLARGHLSALPYPDVPKFVANLRERQAVAALALEFCILTASRSGEVFGARWDEIDRNARVWTVPPDRMKGGREHRVPLSHRALEILDRVETIRTSDYVFPGKLRAAPLSAATMHQVLRRMNVENATVHGFRSSFRDWAGECTSFPREIAEAALAHVVGNDTEHAYRRGDALEKRRKLMEAWAGFLASPRAAESDVTPLRKEASA